MAFYDLLFRNVLYPTAVDYSDWICGDIGVSDGVYAETGPALSASAKFEEARPHLVLLPGLSNMHTHSHDIFWRGAKDSVPIDAPRPSWYERAMAGIPTEGIACGAMMTYLQNALCGVTYVMDHLRRDLPSRPFTRALAAVGLRGRVHSHCAEDTQTPFALLHETSPDFESSLDRACAMPRGPIMVHAQETPRRLDRVYEQFGRSTIELLDSRGLLHSQTFLVHLGYHSDQDLTLIRARGAHVVATPAAEMKLGENTFDPMVARERGISFLLGTDGPAYDASEDLFAEMRMLSLLASRKHGPGALPPKEILQMTTTAPATALGLPSSFPRPGAPADFVLIDGRDLGVLPIVREPFQNVTSQLVHGVSRGAIAFVSVGGVLVVTNGRAALVDQDEVARRFVAEARSQLQIH